MGLTGDCPSSRRRIQRPKLGGSSGARRHLLHWSLRTCPYSHFNVNRETFVVYAGRVFRYPSGDKAGRAEAEDYGRSVGVPEPQLDWDENE
jgi:hypothetical protein